MAGLLIFPQKVFLFGNGPSQLGPVRNCTTAPVEVDSRVPFSLDTFSIVTAVTAPVGIGVEIIFDETYIHLQGDV
jgi:hypothetical protein